jgi:hypothetical protein
MDGIKLNCYDLHILMILCSQLVYLYLSIVLGDIHVYAIPFMTAKKIILLDRYYYYRLPEN